MICANKNTPDRLHIVCGRGKGYEDFAGNKHFRTMIQEYAAAYSSKETTRGDKSAVIRTIANHLQSRGIRFVKQNFDTQQWIDLEEKEIKIKIGHALRDVNAIRRKQERSRKRKQAAKITLWASRTFAGNGKKVGTPAAGQSSCVPSTDYSQSKSGASAPSKTIPGSNLDQPMTPSKISQPTPQRREWHNTSSTRSTNQPSVNIPLGECASANDHLPLPSCFIDTSFLMLARKVPPVSDSSSSSVSSHDWVEELMAAI